MHAVGDRYRLEISGGKLRYARYRSGARSVVFTSAAALPAYPLSFSLSANPQNAEWQNTALAQLAQTVSWSSITNGVDLGNGSVRKTSTGSWDFSAVPRQHLVYGNGYFESTAASTHQLINLTGADGSGRFLAVGAGGWAGIYENGQEVAATCCRIPSEIISVHAVGDRYRLEISGGKLRYVRYRSGARSVVFTSAASLPAYPLSFSLSANPQNAEWQNTVFSDNLPEHNDAAFVSQSVPATMIPGQNYNVSVTMRNTGASSWTTDGEYQLASENLPDNQRWGLSRVNLTTPVLPGSDGTLNFTVTAPASGSHSFQWRMVQQGVERFGASTGNVNVQTVNGAPAVSLTSPANNAVITAGATLSLSANASDSDGTVSKVEFFQGAVKLGEDTTAPYTCNWTSVPAGSYVLSARATDNGGATATSSAVNITVTAPNQPPTITLTTPANNATFTAGATVQLSADASDSDGTINKVEFFQGGTKLGEDTSVPYGLSWNSIPEGAHALTARATDNAGLSTTSVIVNVTVTLPVVTVVATDATASEPGTDTGIFTISRTGNTGAALVVTYSVAGTAASGNFDGQDDYDYIGTSVTIPAGASAYTISVNPIDNPAVEAAETVILTVTNSQYYGVGTPSSATVTIYDNDTNPPTVSITSPTHQSIVSAGTPITIDAVASDSDGTITKVEFYEGSAKLGEDVSSPYSFAWGIVPAGDYLLTARATDNAGAVAISSQIQVVVNDFTPARLDPANGTGGGGENPLSRNFNWSVPLVGLPGRSGLDLGLSLSYNSLVWTKSGSFISFDDDQGFPSPGFRLGFPVIQSSYFNSEVGKNAFLLITSNGERVELRQVGTSQLYEAADSSHLLLDASTSPMILRSTDGTQLTYDWKGSDYQCTEIKDRNGNFITINYTAFGRIDTVVDTLSRTIDFNYDGTNTLTSISQTWTVNGAPQTRTWASFIYNNTLPIETNFSVGVTNVGPQNGSTLKVLTRVTFGDSSRFDLDYTSWGQVWKVSNFAVDGITLLNYRSYNLRGSPLLPTGTEGDCPRFTERRDWAKNWNRDGSGVEQEAITQFEAPVSTSWTLPGGTQQSGMRAQVTLPNGTYHKIYFHGTAGTSTGWHRGLSSMEETFDSVGLQRRSVTTWAQDTAVSYPLNPRVVETNVYDGSGSNRRRVTTGYASFALPTASSCHLPTGTQEYAADATTVLRRTEIDYRMHPTSDAAYLTRHIIGLVKEQRLYGVNAGVDTLMSQVGFAYDETAIQGSVSPVKHDNANYSASFVVGRANLTKVKRYDTFNTSLFVETSSKYNRAGAVVETTDAANHTVTISYTDAFAAEGDTLDPALSFSTLAYPTMVTDADSYSSSMRYNYDFGAGTWKRTPTPNLITNTPGPKQITVYDSLGRVERVTNLVNNAYTRFIYGPNYVETFASVNNVADEAHSVQVFDGAGRVIAKASNHPGSTGGFSGQLVHYDEMGRAIKQSNPTETSISITSAPILPYGWQAAGDDALAGWVYTQQTYDWKGRPLITTNPSVTGNPSDTTTKEAMYNGCGCAGGEVVTLTDEVGRRQKTYSDVLGRAAKSEVLNWDGSIYSTTVNTYNTRDQVTQVRQFAGPEGSGTYQDTTMTYDGQGRLKTRHLPEQQVDPNNGASTDHTTWDYFNDDTIQKMTDARGASQTFSYNGRHLVRTITFFGPTGVQPTADIECQYDAVGNRLWMTDGLGRVDYEYTALSQLKKESRQFAVGTFNIDYLYNLAGQLTKVTDPFGASFDYQRNSQGQLTSVTGTPYGGVSSYVSDVMYRAWGAPKSVSYGGSGSTIAYNARMQPKEFRLTVTGSGASMIREDYAYFGDSRLATLTDLDDTAGSNPPVTLRFLSRQYSYDHVGRTTGSHGGTGGGVPYSQGYSYDEFGNMKGRTGAYYNYNNSLPTSDTASYTDNRRTGWSYNADGQVVATPASSTDSPRTMSYDAAGRMVTSVDTGSFNTVTYSASYDGDGQLVYESSNTSPGSSETSYIVRSTVLGEVLTRLDQSGNKKTTHVPAEGLLFATQRSSGGPGPYVHATHRNPLGITETNMAVYDPLGNYIPFQAHGDPRPPAGSFSSASMPGLSASQANPDGYGMGCLRDDLPASCYSVLGALNRDGARQVIISGTQNPLVSLANGGITFVTSRRQVSLGDPNDPLDEYNSIPFAVDSLDYAHGAPGGQKGFERNPQKPNQTVIDLVNTMLTSQECFDFLKTVLNKASTESNPVLRGGDIRAIFTDFLAQKKGGISRDLGGAKYGTVEGRIGSDGKGNGIIRRGYSTGNQDEYDASGIVNELPHLAGSKGGYPKYGEYGDLELARATYDSGYDKFFRGFTLPNPFLQFPDRKAQEKNRSSVRWSSYFHDILKQLCIE